MNVLNLNRLALLAFAMAGLSACNQAAAPAEASTLPVAQAASQAGEEAAAVLPRMTVYKTPTCGCCGAWVDHMREAGFVLDVHDMNDLGPVKQRLGVPYTKGSCHTAEVGGYLIEGHIPAADVRRLLEEKPDARGLVLPGMPLGSPGMEVPDGHQQPYTVELVRHDGTTEPFAQH